MARHSAAPTRVTVARINRAETSPARDGWRPRMLLKPLFEREPFDLFGALTARLVEMDPDEAAPDESRSRARPATVDVPTNLPLESEEEPFARLALPGGFSFDPAHAGAACYVHCACEPLD